MADDKPLPTWLSCQNLQEWHDWLAGHDQQAMAVWLKIKKARSKEAGVTLAEAVVEAICFGWIDGKMYSLDADSYILRFTPRQPDSLWSKINRQRAEALQAAGRMTPAGLQTILAAQANGTWQSAYSSQEKPQLPTDLAAALAADPEARGQFDRWSNSEQLQAAGWIEQAKRPQTRQRRIDQVVSQAHNGLKLFS